jgi:aspartate/methionine/tyrosine aminotransferase
MSGLSKIAGLPQMKLGWIVTNNPAAYEKLELIADTYLSVGTPVQQAAPQLLELGEQVYRQIAQRVRANLDALAAALAAAPACTLLNVEAGWCATVQVPRIRREEEWVIHLLAQSDLLVQPGYFYDFESQAYLVVSLLTHPETFRDGIARLVSALA